ncbi:Uncharacterized membrane protein [Actinacidiphila alni]|uniref:Uncharacterized membrane protein n=1 Tax=Actinacidiphila alni TaxID=380248 RepID=A0A1I1X4W7_9ACTN|nr:anthrone oxygenase family protein [Actinacidiphila alni]SFE02454.1 Uncharacterized membrane protein [Actinacidiphila alni]
MTENAHFAPRNQAPHPQQYAAPRSAPYPLPPVARGRAHAQSGQRGWGQPLPQGSQVPPARTERPRTEPDRTLPGRTDRTDRTDRKGGFAMSGDIRSLVLLAATLATGLMAGLYFAFSVAVMPGLGASDDRTLIEAMQRINVAILNGWFSLAFGGALVLGGVAAALHWRGDGRAALPWIIAGVVLYAASLIVTMGFNVPLNDKLAAAGDPSKIHDPAAVREQFQSAWLRWNVARVLTTTAALGCLAWALRLGRG